ncbi:hypothetical protein FB451DRAFT_1386291 [Mycena latifolia]|nr:hypothetical protein FB451DRAFT_1386291 [Mycena latifolia]
MAGYKLRASESPKLPCARLLTVALPLGACAANPTTAHLGTTPCPPSVAFLTPHTIPASPHYTAFLNAGHMHNTVLYLHFQSRRLLHPRQLSPCACFVPGITALVDPTCAHTQSSLTAVAQHEHGYSPELDRPIAHSKHRLSSTVARRTVFALSGWYFASGNGMQYSGGNVFGLRSEGCVSPHVNGCLFPI